MLLSLLFRFFVTAVWFLSHAIYSGPISLLFRFFMEAVMFLSYAIPFLPHSYSVPSSLLFRCFLMIFRFYLVAIPLFRSYLIAIRFLYFSLLFRCFLMIFRSCLIAIPLLSHCHSVYFSCYAFHLFLMWGANWFDPSSSLPAYVRKAARKVPRAAPHVAEPAAHRGVVALQPLRRTAEADDRRAHGPHGEESGGVGWCIQDLGQFEC